MPIYTIIAPDDSTLQDSELRKSFPDAIVLRPGAAWFVKTAVPTCAEVRDLVRESSEDRTTCVVVKTTEYNGYAKRDVWEKMEAWERE